ncbi:MAG: flagellar biosynthetic protein FliR [Bdellovibrionales bacterium]|nr:flagellar biosynthetic protein FliR [Bdellovibrionales bacterium]
MDAFSLDQNQILTFFAVLVRFATLVAVLPWIGDRVVPTPVKVMLALTLSGMLYPMLESTGRVDPARAEVWGATAAGIIGVTALEALFGLALGFVARMVFIAVETGGNLAGTYMGFSMASMYDPHQESQTQVVAQVHTTLAMLIFLALDGHHLMLQAALDSYSIVGVGGAGFGQAFADRLITLSSETLKIGLQMAAPMAVALFAINVVYGVMSKAMPQLNVLILSFSVSALVGLAVMLMSLPEFHSTTGWLMARMGEEMNAMMSVLGKG